ncbi:flotillin-like FloA family protein [Flammeovirga agarivorans]|uniref:Uncharacterized protein n=1 Tax=Flammeovirga agarivorans TaxID=2726742 RepID=A0A7X8SRI8_9BACT|nr:flotillin-like FloA family protein [Flammeovirga agarivorans]NLR95096.1 hypothetical protein [Flammeovirga agarivorans]
MELLILLLLFIFFFASILLLPAFFIVIRAKRFHAQLTIGQAFSMRIRKTASDNVLKGLAIVQEHNFNVSLSELETLELAGGDPYKVMEAMVNYSHVKSLNIKTLFAMNLSGLDFKDAIEKNLIEQEIKLEKQEFGGFIIDYHVKYKYRIGVGQQKIVKEEIEKEISQRLLNFFMYWEGDNLFNINNYIKTNVLNHEYWDKILCLDLNFQEIEIKNK